MSKPHNKVFKKIKESIDDGKKELQKVEAPERITERLDYLKRNIDWMEKEIDEQEKK